MGSPQSGNSILSPPTHIGLGIRVLLSPLLDIAEAAEQAWIRAEGTRSYIGSKAAI